MRNWPNSNQPISTFGAGAVFDEATFSEDANFSGGTSPLFFGLALLALHGRVKR